MSSETEERIIAQRVNASKSVDGLDCEERAALRKVDLSLSDKELKKGIRLYYNLRGS